MEYILVARSCDDCGGDFAVKTFAQKPSKDDERSLIDSLGGMYCIQTSLFKRNKDGEYDVVQGGIAC
jgi:hypothetical protein